MRVCYIFILFASVLLTAFGASAQSENGAVLFTKSFQKSSEQNEAAFKETFSAPAASDSFYLYVNSKNSGNNNFTITVNSKKVFSSGSTPVSSESIYQVSLKQVNSLDLKIVGNAAGTLDIKVVKYSSLTTEFAAEEFTRAAGKTQTFTRNFNSQNPGGLHFLVMEGPVAAANRAVAMIKVNGQRVIKSSDWPCDVNGRVMAVVALQSVNKLDISLAGNLGAKIKISILSTNASVIPEGQIVIIEPQENILVRSDSVLVKAKVITSASNFQVFVDDDEVSGVQANQDFEFTKRGLDVGSNGIQISAYVGNQLIASKNINIDSLPVGSNADYIDPATGGVISISDGSDLDGVSLSVPHNALDEESYITLTSSDAADLPFDVQAVGTGLSMHPLGIQFAPNALLSMPYEPLKLPPGTMESNVRFYIYANGEWTPRVPNSISSGLATIEINRLDFQAIQLGAPVPLKFGDLKITSNVAGASIFLDGVITDYRTPAIIPNLDNGPHQLKLFSEGYNEVIQDFTYSSAANVLNVNLTPEGSLQPTITLSSGIADGMSTEADELQLSGTVQIAGGFGSGFIVVSNNFEESIYSVSSDGSFSISLPLFPDENDIQIRVTVDGKTGIGPSFTVNKVFADALELKKIGKTDVPVTDKSRFLRIIFTWSNPVNLDMLVFGPNGQTASPIFPNGIAGGKFDLDHDSKRATFTFPVAEYGHYGADVELGNKFGYAGTSVSISIYRGNQLLARRSKALRVSYVDYLRVGASLPVPTEFPLRITSIKPEPSIPKTDGLFTRKLDIGCARRQGYLCVNHRFTTKPSEANITVETFVENGIVASEIKYQVKELTTNANIIVLQQGKKIAFQATQFLNWSSGPKKPLVYEVIAYTDSGAASEPAYIVQDVRSQIRQEYITKKDIWFDFKIDPPGPDLLVTKKSIPGPFAFSKYVAHSDYSIYGIGMLGPAPTFATEIEHAYSAGSSGDDHLELSSGWRNPWRNDILPESGLNSWHQLGGAIDLTLHLKTGETKSQIDQRFMDLCELAYSSTTNANVKYHAGHVHIEPSGKERTKKCGTQIKKRSSNLL